MDVLPLGFCDEELCFVKLPDTFFANHCEDVHLLQLLAQSHLTSSAIEEFFFRGGAPHAYDTEPMPSRLTPLLSRTESFKSYRSCPHPQALFIDRETHARGSLVVRLAQNAHYRGVPADQKQRLETITTTLSLQNAHLLAQVSNLVVTLNQHDIKPIFMSALAHKMLGMNAYPRYFNEASIAFVPREYKRAQNLLSQMGFTSTTHRCLPYKSFISQDDFPVEIRLYRWPELLQEQAGSLIEKKDHQSHGCYHILRPEALLLFALCEMTFYGFAQHERLFLNATADAVELAGHYFNEIDSGVEENALNDIKALNDKCVLDDAYLSDRIHTYQLSDLLLPALDFMKEIDSSNDVLATILTLLQNETVLGRCSKRREPYFKALSRLCGHGWPTKCVRAVICARYLRSEDKFFKRAKRLST